MIRTVLTFSAALLGLALAGCGPRDSPAAAAESSATIDAQMAKVKADPNMPPQARAAALASMERAKAQGHNPPTASR